MNLLKKLIQNLCPDGVKSVPLWTVTIWDKRFNTVDRKKQVQVINYHYLLAANLFALERDGGDVFLLSTGERVGWTTQELAGPNMHEGEVVTIPWGKTRPVTDCIKYYKGKFVTADNRIMTSFDTSVLLNKYLYYWIMTQGKIIDGFYRGSGIQHPNMAKILDMQIPVPPLEVQREIVRILDHFTELTAKLTAELTAELTARKMQYEYYRDSLLTQQKNAQWMTLGDIGSVCMCKRIMKAETSREGDVPFFKIGTFGKEPDAYITWEKFAEYSNKYSFPRKGDVLISAAGTIGRAVIYDGDPAYYQDSNIVWLDNDESKVLNKYLFYYYQLQPWAVSTGGTIARLYNDNISRAKISVPSLDEQTRIVSILDRFDALCNDLTSGLPAEIQARQKQYEYYRDKLLSFPALQG